MVFSYDTLILSGSVDNTFKLWDNVTGNPIKTFQRQQEAMIYVCFYNDVTLIFSGNGVKKIQ